MEKTSTYKIPICHGQLLSGPKCSEKVLLLNFEPCHIKVNKPALEEMNCMRNGSIFPWEHPVMWKKKNVMTAAVILQTEELLITVIPMILQTKELLTTAVPVTYRQKNC